jgi:hypothetical protein
MVILKVTLLLEGHKKNMSIMFRVTLVPSLTFTTTYLYFVCGTYVHYIFNKNNVTHGYF